MNTTSKTEKSLRQQRRLDSITDGFGAMHIIVMAQTAVNAVCAGIILHMMIGDHPIAAAIGYAASLCFGLLVYLKIVRTLTAVIGNLVRLMGEPARVRNQRNGRFIPTSAVEDGQRKQFLVIDE